MSTEDFPHQISIYISDLLTYIHSYIGIVYIGLMSIFLTIIGDAFTTVKEDTALQSNDYEIVDFMWKKIKAIIG